MSGRLFKGEGEIIEFTIRDCSGGKIESFKCNINDHKKCYQIIGLLKVKYGFSTKADKIDKDLGWLNRI